MKNLKKLVALTLTVAMLLSSFTVAFAANSADATTCEALEVIKGEGDEGVTAEYLASTPTRKQAALMSLRLRGLEAEALAYTGTEKFDDQDTVAAFWQPILSYLKANPELGWIGTKVTVEGVEKTNFNPDKLMEGKPYVKVMLEALGYKQDVDFEYKDTFTFAATVGLTIPAEPFTVDALCKATVEALKATTADGAELYKSLFTDDQAVAAGLIEAPTELVALSATMTNLAEVVITFNADVTEDDADLVGSYVVEANDVAKTIDSVSVDGNVVTLNMTLSAIDQQDSVVVTVNDEVGVAEDTELVVGTVIDRELPEVADVVVSGPNSFKVTFTEPLSKKPAVTINNKAIATKVECTLGSNVATVEALSALTDGTTYTLEVSEAEDFNGYVMPTTTKTVTYGEVENVVTVEVTDVTETTVEVTFSTEVTGVTTACAWHSFSAYAPVSVSDDGDGVYTFTFHNGTTGYYIPYANVTFKLDAEDIEDAWGNLMADDYVTTIKAVEDAEAPTVKVIEVKDDETTVEFSEAVKAFTDAEVTMKDADDEEISVTVSAGDEDNQFVIEYALQPGGDYTFEIKDVVDNSLAENALNPDPTTLVITITDTSAPDITGTSAVWAGNVIFVTFDDAMNDSVLDVDVWRAVSGGSVQLAPDTVEFWGTSNKEVQLTFDLDEGEDLTAVNGEDLIIGKVADASGNYVSEISTTVTVTGATDAVILGVKTVAKNEIAITVEGIVNDGLDTDNIVVANFDDSATAAAASISVEYDDGDTIITATLQAGVTFAAAEVPTSVALSNMTIDKGFDVTTAKFTAATDGIAPTYSTTVAAIAATTGVALEFDEALEIDPAYQAAMAYDLVVVADGELLDPIHDYTTTVVGPGLLEIDLLVTVEEDVTIKTVDAPQYIVDLAGNAANAIDDVIELEVTDL